MPAPEDYLLVKGGRGLLRTKIPVGRVMMGEPRSLGEEGSGP